MSNEIQDAVAELWDYMQLKQPVKPADAVIVLGSRDDRVAAHAAILLSRGLTPHCVVTGGTAHYNDLLRTSWVEGTEAEHFANVMKTADVDTKELLIEDGATNTGENATYSHKVLSDAKVSARSLLLVTKPYMERRALATFQAQWPDRSAMLSVTSQGGSIEQYCNEHELYDNVVNTMVGDFQRIVEYPKLGYQTEQPVSHNVQQAFELLISAGFTKHLL